MSQDDVTTEEVVEQIDGSEETQNIGEEDNSLSESKKNPSNFKKLAKKLKEERRERERLQAELDRLKSGEEDEDDSFMDEEDTDELFTDVKSEIWFMKNKDAEQYRDKMSEMVEENPMYGKLPLKDLYDLAQARFKKSVSKTNFDVSSGKSGIKVGSTTDFSKMTEEQIEKLDPAESKLFLDWMKKQ